jgi:hypothetical protein
MATWGKFLPPGSAGHENQLSTSRGLPAFSLTRGPPQPNMVSGNWVLEPKGVRRGGGSLPAL